MDRVRSTLAIIAIATALLTPAGALAADKPVLATFQIEPRGAALTDNELGALSDYLVSEAERLLGVRALQWQQTYRVLRGMDLYMCMDRRCQMQVEAAMKADYSLVVVINKMGKTCIMNATLYPSQGPASVRTAMHKGGCGGDDFTAGIEEMVATMAAHGPLPKLSPIPAAGPVVVAAGPGKPPDPVQRPEPGQPGAVAVITDKPAPAQPSDLRDIDRMPRFSITGGLLYAPAPLILHERQVYDDFTGSFGTERTTSKVPDNVGPVIAFDWRFWDYLFFGGQTGLMFIQDASQIEATTRFGALVPISPTFSLHGWVGLGVQRLKVDAGGDLDGNYNGGHMWLAVGFRHQPGNVVGWSFEISGTAAQELGEDQDFIAFRLNFQVGLIFGWARPKV